MVEVLHKLLFALERDGFSVLAAADAPKYDDPDFGMSFQEMQKENGGKLSKAYSHARTSMPAVGLTICSLKDEDRLDRTLISLEAAKIKATFFINGLEAEDYPERVQAVLSAGHSIQNGGMSGEDLSEASVEEVCFEIFKCEKLLRERYNMSMRFFMPPGGKVTDNILEAASILGYTVTTYNKNPLISAGSIPDNTSLISYFRHGVNRGDILYFPLGLYENWDTFIPYVSNMVQRIGYRFETVETMYANQYSDNNLQSIPGWNAIRINNTFDRSAEPGDWL